MRHKRSKLIGAAGLLFVVAACGGDSVGQPQTEEGALAAVKTATEGALQGKSGAVLNFLSAECRANVDEDEVKLAVSLAPAFFGDLFEDFDLGDIDAVPTIVSYEGDKARVDVAYRGPDGTDVDTLGLSSDTMNIEYDGKKWVDTGCDFEDTSQIDADRTADALAELGYAATREDPVPRSVGAPVGNGYVVSVDAMNPDGAAAIEAMDGFLSEPEPGEQFVLVSVTVGYNGSDEPQSVNGFNAQIIGGASSVGFDNFGCGSFDSQLSSSSSKLFAGGIISGDFCFVVPGEEIPGMLLSMQGGFGSDSGTIFDPNAAADTPVPVVGSTGPSADGDYTPGRQAPTALGQPVDLGDGWTITINGSEPDATATLLAANEFNDPPPAGFVYSLVDMTLAFDGDEEPSSIFSVSVDVVGDSNVSGSNCSVSDVPDEIDRFADLFKGGSLSGNQCFVVNADDLDSLVVFASADFFSDDTFVLAVK